MCFFWEGGDIVLVLDGLGCFGGSIVLVWVVSW